MMMRKHLVSALRRSLGGGGGGGFRRQDQHGRGLYYRGMMAFCTDSRREEMVAYGEAKRLLRLANVEALKRSLQERGADRDTMSVCELLEMCTSSGLADSAEDARSFAKSLDDAGVVLIFRNTVYLHPAKVAELVTEAVPLVLADDDDPRKEELEKLRKEKEEIDRIAHRQVRCMLWTGLGCLTLQAGLFFRLTFWEFSWDVMEPIAFFGTTSGLLVGYMYFLFTSRDPSYQDFRKSLFTSRQKKVFKKRNFDIDRFLLLQRQCECQLLSHKGRHL